MTKVLRAVRQLGTVLTIATVVAAGGLYGQVLLYVPAQGSNQLWEYGITSATGNPFNFPTQPISHNGPNIVGVTPNNRFMYVGSLDGNIDGFVVNYDGTLTAIGAPYANAGSVAGLAVDSTGQYLYASNNTGNHIRMFQINQTTGVLTLPGTDVANVSGPRAVVADTSGHLYAALSGTDRVVSYRIESNGSLTELNQVAAGTTPDRLAVAVTNSGTYLYASNFLSGNISVYTVQGNGALAVNTTVSTGAGSRPLGLTADNSNRFLIVALNSSTVANNVAVFAIGPTGNLTSVGATPSQTGLPALTFSFPTGVAVDPSNRYLYVANSGTATVTKFNFDANTGALSVPGNFATGNVPQYLVSRPAPVNPATVPAASTWSLVGLGILLAGTTALMYRRA